MPDQRWRGAAAVDWPKAGTRTVPLRAAGVDAARSGGATAELRVLGQDVSKKLGIDGVIYTAWGELAQRVLGGTDGKRVNCAAGGYNCTDSNGNNLGSCGSTGTCRDNGRGSNTGLSETFTGRGYDLGGGNELFLSGDDAYLNGVPLTGAWDDPLELALDVLEAMEEFGLSNSGWGHDQGVVPAVREL